MTNWVKTTPTSEIVESVTYDLYESNNPFRNKFTKEDIKNPQLRLGANITREVGAEAFSVFTNPYYIPHKVMQIPVAYQSVVDLYNKNAGK